MENNVMNIREALRKPLPKEAISQHPTKTYLSAIKAIYVEERLNDVFGIGKWTTKVEHVVTEKSQKANKNGVYPIMVVCKLIFQIPSHGIYHECYGGNDNEDLGDAYKGATTDALTKIGSYLEIGIDVFKGKVGNSKVPDKQQPEKRQDAPRPTKTPDPAHTAEQSEEQLLKALKVKLGKKMEGLNDDEKKSLYAYSVGDKPVTPVLLQGIIDNYSTFKKDWEDMV